MKHIFIVNKISGKGQNMKLIGILEDIALALGLDHEIRLTQYPKHAKLIASEYKGRDDVCLYSMGGDGTLFEVINGMDLSQTLAIIPTGSGNDYYRQFLNKESYDIKDIIAKTIIAETKDVDIGRFNDERFINTLSIGIDAKINEDASKMIRKTLVTKGPAYIGAIAKNVIIPKATKADIVIDDKSYSGDFYILAIMNGQYYGNGKHSAPQADIADGYLDVTVADKCKATVLYPRLIKYLNGTHLDDPYFKITKAKNIKVKSDSEFIYQADGETYHGNKIDVQIDHGALHLKKPIF